MIDKLKWVAYLAMRGIFHTFDLIPIKHNKIVLNSFGGKGFFDNPKYIALELLKRKQDLDLVWIVNDINEQVPAGIRKVRRHTAAEVLELSTAKVWVDNVRIPLYMHKRKHQYYVETWHGCIGLKRTGTATNNRNFLADKRIAHGSKLADLMVSNSDFTDRLYRGDYRYKGKILRAGSPKVDFLINISEKEKAYLRARYGIREGKKVLLYAPTFRDADNTDVYDVDFERVLDVLQKRMGGDWIVLIKLHPLTDEAHLFAYSDRILNMTKCKDIYELMAISDALISDYSSVLFEMGLIYKPVFIYAKDEKEVEALRGLCFSMKSLPFPCAHTNDELIENIASFNAQDYTENIDKFNSQFLKAAETGKASAAVADYILEKVGK